jgi:hypothetical protein
MLDPERSFPPMSGGRANDRNLARVEKRVTEPVYRRNPIEDECGPVCGFGACLPASSISATTIVPGSV